MKSTTIRATTGEGRTYRLPIIAQYEKDTMIYSVIDSHDWILRGIVDYVRWEKYNVYKKFLQGRDFGPFLLSGSIEEIEENRTLRA